MKKYYLLFLSLLAIGASAPMAHAALDDTAEGVLLIGMDRAHIVRVSQPIATVLLGNPAYVDVSVQNDKTIILTGKSFGTTNLIALGPEDEVIAEATLVVGRPQESIVFIYRGSNRQSYSCTPDCAPTPITGDDAAHFDLAIGQAASKQGAGNAAAGQ